MEIWSPWKPDDALRQCDDLTEVHRLAAAGADVRPPGERGEARR